MATVTRTYTPANVFQGPCDIYFSITPPASSLTPLADANCLILDATGQPTSSTGSHAGSIDGPTNILITEKVNEIHDDQHESPIDVGFDSIEAEIDIIIKETNLGRFVPLSTAQSLMGYTSLANSQVIQIGGQFDSSANLISMLVVSPRRDAAGKFLYALFYKTYLDSVMQTAFTRAKESTWKLKYRAVCDFTRVQGDELLQIVRQK